MKSTIAVFTAFLALAAVAAAQTEEEANYADATSFVQTFLKQATAGTQSDKETACAKLANDAIEDIKDKCKTEADAMNKLAKGKETCCNSGMKIFSAAKKNFDDKTAAYAKCKTDLAALKKAKVSFPSINLDELSPGKCESFFTGNSYREAKATADAKSKECETLKGAVESYKKSMDEANNGKKDEVDKCQCDEKKAFATALATAKKTCESEASKTAFTRSKHLLCVLEKKDLKDCKVGDAPSLPEINYVKAKCNDIGGRRLLDSGGSLNKQESSECAIPKKNTCKYPSPLTDGSVVAFKGRDGTGKYCTDNGQSGMRCQNANKIGVREGFKVYSMTKKGEKGRSIALRSWNGNGKYCSVKPLLGVPTLICHATRIYSYQKKKFSFSVKVVERKKIAGKYTRYIVALKDGVTGKICADDYDKGIRCNRGGGIGQWEKLKVECLSGPCSKCSSDPEEEEEQEEEEKQP